MAHAIFAARFIEASTRKPRWRTFGRKKPHSLRLGLLTRRSSTNLIAFCRPTKVNPSGASVTCDVVVPAVQAYPLCAISQRRPKGGSRMNYGRSSYRRLPWQMTLITSAYADAPRHAGERDPVDAPRFKVIGEQLRTLMALPMLDWPVDLFPGSTKLMAQAMQHQKLTDPSTYCACGKEHRRL